MGASWNWPPDIASHVFVCIVAGMAASIILGVVMWKRRNRSRRGEQKPLDSSVKVIDSGVHPEPPATAESQQTAWQVVRETVRGASHQRAALVNQDSIEIWPPEATVPPLIVAVADGHGSPKCFRSAIGSRLAVETTVNCFREFAERSSGCDLSFIKRELEVTFPQEVERRWKASVADHLTQQPLLPNEIIAVGDKLGIKAREEVETRPVAAYGTTLVAVLIHETFIAYVQLGDGDILVVDDTGQVDRPIADDPRLFANETTSLGGEDCWRDFQVKFQSLADRLPALILLATDGYSNAFRTPEDFLRVGPDLLELLRTEGIEYVRNQLPIWLDEASRSGSGDDVTVGLLFRAGSRSAASANSPGEPVASVTNDTDRLST